MVAARRPRTLLRRLRAAGARRLRRQQLPTHPLLQVCSPDPPRRPAPPQGHRLSLSQRRLQVEPHRPSPVQRDQQELGRPPAARPVLGQIAVQHLRSARVAGAAQHQYALPFCLQLRRKQWVVYAKPPFGGPQQVLKYLARYTHRVAIANSRITAANSDSVSFRYQDYAGGHRHRVMKLDSVEFLRRFLQHVLPNRFVRIRHYGLLANRARKQKLPLCRHLIAQASGHHMITAPDLSASLQPAGDDHLRCPVCHAGTMRRIQDFRRQPTWEYLPLRRGPPDTA